MKPIFTFLTLLASSQLFAQLTLGFNFNPSNDGNLCSIAHDDTSVYVYQCFADIINKYDKVTGTFQNSIPFPQSSGANDVDIEIVTTAMTMNSTSVPAGSLLVFDGETDEVEIYAINPTDGTIIATLNTNFGTDHVVGGDFNADNNNFYVIQDKLAPVATRNMVATIENVNGTSGFSFQTTDDGYSINYADVVYYNNRLFVSSDDEDDMAVYSITGDLLQLITLPTEFNNYRSISIHDGTGEMWVCTSSQVVSFNGLNGELSVSDFQRDVLSVYPNPAIDMLYINNLNQSTTYQIYDVLGKAVASGTVMPDRGINVEAFSQGVHILTLENGLTVKFVKQ